MTGIAIILVALAAALLFFIGAEEPRRRLREGAFYLVIVDLVIIGLVVMNVIPGGKP